MISFAAAARAYAARGWFVFPIKTRAKEPLTAHGLLDASRDAATVAGWWQQWPSANIGLHPGRSGFIVLDLDGPTGEAAGRKFGLLSEPTLVCITGRRDGGRHLYFERPPFEVGNNALAPKLDVRGDLGYVILPPSVHPSGAVYRWAGRIDDLRPLPAVALTALRALQFQPAAMGIVKAAAIPALPAVGEGARNKTLTAYAGRLFAKGVSEVEVYDLLLALNDRRCQPPLPEPDVLRIVQSIGKREAAKPHRKKKRPVADLRADMALRNMGVVS
jgi:hypothetical protein